MFDTYTYPSRSVTVTKHRHEHRAPTDKSVELLHEFEKAALAKCVAVSELKDNTLNAQWSVFDDPMNVQLTAICRLKLNGRELTFKEVIERPYSKGSTREIVERIYKHLAEYLVKQLLSDTNTVRTLLRN